MASICPHCTAENPAEAAFCGSCGKALPQVGDAGPRVVASAETAQTAAGQTLQMRDLQQQARKAFSVLLVVAIIQLVCGGALIASGTLPVGIAQDQEIQINPVMLWFPFAIGIIFLILSLWARKNPLPPAIVGLVLFITVHLLDAVADPSMIAKGIIMKIIVILLLVRAIQAGVKHREILRQQHP